jgi:hypothetical protein
MAGNGTAEKSDKSKPGFFLFLHYIYNVRHGACMKLFMSNALRHQTVEAKITSVLPHNL